MEDEPSRSFKKFIKKHRVCLIMGSLGLAFVLCLTIFSVITLIDDERCQVFVFNVDPGDENQNDEYYETTPRHPFSVQDLIRADEISGVAVSPGDAQWVAYIRTVWSTQANVSADSLWIGRTSLSLYRKRITPFQWGMAISSPSWDSTGKRLYFICNNGGSKQVWSVGRDGTGLQQISFFPLNVTDMVLSSNGKFLAFSMMVLPGQEPKNGSSPKEKQSLTSDNIQRSVNFVNQWETGRVKGYGNLDGYLYDNLFVRRWDRWETDLFSHIFLAKVEADKHSLKITLGDPVDVMLGMKVHAPTQPYGTRDEWSFSAQTSSFAYQLLPYEPDRAWTGNRDIHIVSLSTYSIVNTIASASSEVRPRFHPLHNELIAYLENGVPNYEFAQRRLVIKNMTINTTEVLGGKWDKSIAELRWSANGRWLYFTALNEGSLALYRLAGNATQDEIPVAYSTGTHSVLGLYPLPQDEDSVVALYSEMLRPPGVEIFSSGNHFPVTSFNTKLLNKCLFSDPGRPFSFLGAGGDVVFSYLLRPTSIESSMKYPLIVVVHGGPQGAYADAWMAKWNEQILAGAGYFVFIVNFHGSSGYGQEFIDSVQGHWGSKPAEDIGLGVKALLDDYEYGSMIDSQKIVGVGFGYGAYLLNFWNGLEQRDKVIHFSAIVSHGGVFDTRTMYYEMDELWRLEYDFYGPEFQNASVYERFNPLINASRWDIPTMFIHTENDFRFSESQSISAFNLMQRRGIPSVLLYFDEESSRMGNKCNLVFWYNNVLDFIKKYAPAPTVNY